MLPAQNRHFCSPITSVTVQKQYLPRDNVVLLQAIDEMDIKTLREAFKKICTTVPIAMEAGIRNLLVYRDSCDLEYGELVNDDDAGTQLFYHLARVEALFNVEV